MAEPDNKVFPKNQISRQKISDLIAADWARVAAHHGKGVMADAMQCDPRTISNALSGATVPSGEHLINSLAFDETALASTLAAVGLKAVPLKAHDTDAMDLLSGLGVMVGDMADRLRDGVFCHNDEIAAADLARELIPALHALVARADKRRVG